MLARGKSKQTFQRISVKPTKLTLLYVQYEICLFSFIYLIIYLYKYSLNAYLFCTLGFVVFHYYIVYFVAPGVSFDCWQLYHLAPISLWHTHIILSFEPFPTSCPYKMFQAYLVYSML